MNISSVKLMRKPVHKVSQHEICHRGDAELGGRTGIQISQMQSSEPASPGGNTPEALSFLCLRGRRAIDGIIISPPIMEINAISHIFLLTLPLTGMI